MLSNATPLLVLGLAFFALWYNLTRPSPHIPPPTHTYTHTPHARSPVVTSSCPNMSSSATRPPMHTSSRAIIWRRLMLVASSSGSWLTMPSAMPCSSTTAAGGGGYSHDYLRNEGVARNSSIADAGGCGGGPGSQQRPTLEYRTISPCHASSCLFSFL